MQEIELKIVPTERAEAIWARIRRLGLSEGKRSTKKLETAYFDTPDLRLKQAGIALRVRHIGRRWIQTVKVQTRVEAGLSRSIEVEKPVPHGQLDLDGIAHDELRRSVFEAAADARLITICETHIRRTAQVLKLGETRVEFAFDTGTLVAGDLSALWSEIEFELLEGHPAILFDLAKAIFPSGGLSFSRLNKSARALRLRETGSVIKPIEPHRATGLKLQNDTMEGAARRILADCLDQIAINVEVVCAMEDAEGPHQLRVGLRRLRSALKIMDDVIGNEEMRRLNEEARWLACEVGALRDLDACAADVIAPEVASHPDEPGLETLRLRLQGQADTTRTALRETLVSGRTQAFLFDLAKAVATCAWKRPEDETQAALLEQPVQSYAEEALRAAWKKAAKQASEIDTLDIEARHVLRKTLKTLRYSVEFWQSCFSPKRVKAFLKNLKKMQAVLGSLNDAAVTRTLLANRLLVDPKSPEDQRVAGWILGATQARSEYGWREAKYLWNALRRADRFWRRGA